MCTCSDDVVEREHAVRWMRWAGVDCWGHIALAYVGSMCGIDIQPMRDPCIPLARYLQPVLAVAAVQHMLGGWVGVARCKHKRGLHCGFQAVERPGLEYV